jgi:hypothetical protein
MLCNLILYFYTTFFLFGTHTSCITSSSERNIAILYPPVSVQLLPPLFGWNPRCLILELEGIMNISVGFSDEILLCVEETYEHTGTMNLFVIYFYSALEILYQDKFYIIISGVGLSPLGTAATCGLLYKPQMIDEGDCGAIGGMKIGRGNQSTRRKPAPAPLCPPQIPHDQTRAAAVGSQRLTT